MFVVLFWICVHFLIIPLIIFASVLLIIHLTVKKLEFLHKRYYKGIKTISFVHPFCSDCGGGEKVLWKMITSLISYYKGNASNNFQVQPDRRIKINVISGRNDNVLELKKKLKERFGIEFNKDNLNPNNGFLTEINNKVFIEVELISMRSGYMLRPKNFLTMFLQILGQMYFAFEIIANVYSDVYCDTTGLPFCYYILKYIGHAKVTAYTHYPFISYDMINQVKHNIAGVHSRGLSSKFKILKEIKLLYYKLILKVYEYMGNNCLSFAYVNSTWTFNRMKELWKKLYNKKCLHILYPPCSISLYKEAAKNEERENIIVSFAQFRPEKRQDMQIRILKKLRDIIKLKNYSELEDLELHIIGGVRNSEDQKLYNDLINYARNLGVGEYVKFVPNGSISQITEEFSRAKIGIHTMVEEHFGITLIEMMAAGLIVITHNSAGAKDDILVKRDNEIEPGFLVYDENEYVEQIEGILLNYYSIKNQLIRCSTERAEKFSDEAFTTKFLSQLKQFLF